MNHRSALAAQVSQHVSDAVHWWIKELRELLPPRLTFWLTDAGACNLLLTPLGGARIGLSLHDEAGRLRHQIVLSRDDDIATSIEHLMQQKRLAHGGVPIGLALPPDKFFFREIALPREARQSLETIALRDLLYNTPFLENELYHAYRAEPNGPKIIIRQSVIRRKMIDDAVADLDIAPDTLSFVEVDGGYECYPERIPLREHTQQRRGLRRAFAILAAMALILAISVIALEDRRQRLRLEVLAFEAAAVQEQAKKVRSILDVADQEWRALNKLRSKKQNRPSLLQIWEEISRILPDNSWVQEMRLSKRGRGNEYTITISGFSSAAAALVERLDRSPFLSDVRLTAPIAIDPVEKRERFIVEANIVKPSGASLTFESWSRLASYSNVKFKNSTRGDS